MPHSDWIEHRRDDGERVGWIIMRGDGFVPIDILGRELIDDPVDWLAAERMLDELGIGFLAEKHVLRAPGIAEQPVRIAEVSVAGITVVNDDFGAASAVGVVTERFEFPFPLPAWVSLDLA